MMYLKQSTASQSALLGPFVDPTDGSVETGLTVNVGDIRISKAGGNIVAKDTSGGGTHDELGMYTVTFNATDTDTVGTMQVMVDNASALPVYHEFTVLEENVYDAMIGGSAALGTDIASILADTNELQVDDTPGAIAALNDVAATDIVSSGAITTSGGGVTTVANVTTVNGLAANAVTAAATAADFGTEVANAVWALDATSQQTQGTFGQAVGDPGATAKSLWQAIVSDAAGVSVSADVIAVKAETALIVADTNELQTDDVPGLITALNDVAAGDVWGVDATTQQTAGTFGQAIGDPAANAETMYDAIVTDAAGTNVAADIVAVKAETALIVGDTNELQVDDVPGLIAALNDITAASVWAVDATGEQTQGTFGQAVGDPGVTAKSLWQAIVSDAAGVSVSADVIAVKAETANILTDTIEIGAAGAGLSNINLPNQTMDITGNITGNLSGSVGSVTGAVGSVTGAVGSVTGAIGSVAGNVDGNVTGSVGSLGATAKTDVNTEVDTALNTTTYAEPSAVLAATATLQAKISWLAALSRNKLTQTATTQTLRNDADAVDIATAAVSDDATTATRNKFA